MKTFFLFIASTFLFFGSSLAASCVSLGNGNWNNPATWSCGVVPTGGDNITIQIGDTVTISSVTNILGAPVTLNIDGVFLFNSPSAKLRLPCGSVIIISATGSIESTGVGQSSHSIRICGSEVWSGKDGTLSGPLVIGIVLPIELTFFDAEVNGVNIDFSWQTASELNNNYFTIEGSMDGFSWNSMHRIDGAGTTMEEQNYALQSQNKEMYSYFRLKQTDYDGNFTYSDLVSVELLRDELKIYPNPSNGLTINIELPAKVSGMLQILHADGREAHSVELIESRTLHLNYLNLKSGTYFVRVVQEDVLYMERLVVQ